MPFYGRLQLPGSLQAHLRILVDGLGRTAEAATAARSTLVEAVGTARAAKALPEGDPERVAALILAVAHEAVDLALSGHLSTTRKGHASAEDLVDDLIRHITTPGNCSSALWSLTLGRSALHARSAASALAGPRQ